jgi:molybdopterin synthase catalytic subunit
MPKKMPMSANITIRLQAEDFDAAAESARLTRGRTDIGAVVTFAGVCRGGEGKDAIAAMTLEHYPGMAEEEIARHAAQAQARWPLMGLTIIHRFGRVTPGDNIVLVVAASAHREAAFEAAQFMMDYLKTHAPFWKREERASGQSWVEAQDHDDAAAARWSQPAKR